MADTYTFVNTSTSSDTKVKLLLAQTSTVAAERVFSDEEIALFLTMDTNVYMASAFGLMSIATDAVRRAKMWEVKGDIVIDSREQPKHFNDLIEQFKSMAYSDSGMEIGTRPIHISPTTGVDSTEYNDTDV